MVEPVPGQGRSEACCDRLRAKESKLTSVMHWIVGSDWLWVPLLAVSVLIVVAMLVATGAAAAALVVPCRRWARRATAARTEVLPFRPPSRPAPGAGQAGAPVASFWEPAWGVLPLGTRPADKRSA
jgi:hypothetical protein